MKPGQPNLKHSIDKIHWGEIDEEPIYLFQLKLHNGLRMNVTNYGAIVQSLFVPDIHEHYTDVVLGYDTLAEYVMDPFFLGAVVGRCTNRIGTGEVRIQNKKYSLSLTKGGFHQHGGHAGFNKKVWKAEPFIQDDAIGIVLEYTSPDGEEGYPGNLQIRVKYTLSENLKWAVDFLAKTDQTTLINPTQHTYFNLSGHANGSITHHTLETPAEYYLPATADLLPNGEIVSVSKTPFDFRKQKTIADQIDSGDAQLLVSKGYDHFLVLEKNATDELKKAATLSSPEKKIKLEVFTTEPGFHFYSGNFLAPSFHGKDNNMYSHRGALCIETHHFPDAPNHSNFPSILLEPQNEFKSRTEFIFNRYE
jgi:aldose 1-epimerase